MKLSNELFSDDSVSSENSSFQTFKVLKSVMISRVRSRINGLVENWTESVMWILCVSTPHWTLDEHSREENEKE